MELTIATLNAAGCAQNATPANAGTNNPNLQNQKIMQVVNKSLTILAEISKYLDSIPKTCFAQYTVQNLREELLALVSLLDNPALYPEAIKHAETVNAYIALGAGKLLNGYLTKEQTAKLKGDIASNENALKFTVFDYLKASKQQQQTMSKTGLSAMRFYQNIIQVKNNFSEEKLEEAQQKIAALKARTVGSTPEERAMLDPHLSDPMGFLESRV